MNCRALAPLLALVFSACATKPTPALADRPETAAARFEARSLQDAGLRAFLVENLGQVPATWDTDALCWVAFHFNPSLDVARAQWATLRAVQQTTATRPNPSLVLTPGFNTTREPGLSPWFPAVNLDFLLPDAEKRQRQQDIARAEAEAARLSLLAAVWPVRIELGTALTDAAHGVRREAALREQAALQRELLTLLEKRLSAGAATAVEVSGARLALLRTEAAAVEAANLQEMARARVAAALGLPVGAIDGVVLPGIPTPVPIAAEALPAARRQSLQSRADVLAALARIEAAEAALALEAAKQRPDFHLGPGYQWDQGANKWSVALSFELPLFQRNEGPVAEAVARRGEAVANFQVVQARALAEIETAQAALLSATRQLDHARHVRDETAKQDLLAQQRIALGAADQLERLAAKLELAIAAAAVAEAEAGVVVASGQLEDALQIPFPHLAALADAGRSANPRTP